MKLSKAISKTPILGSYGVTESIKDRWAERAQQLESEIEELKCKLDEYIEQERARMEEVDHASD